MALIIKGNMPSICKQCKSQGGLADGSFNYICCDDNYLDFYCDGSKPNECQILCEIPDKHGDLIDRQAVLSYFETAFLMGADMDYEDIVGIVSNPKAIPTIVEATV